MRKRLWAVAAAFVVVSTITNNGIGAASEMGKSTISARQSVKLILQKHSVFAYLYPAFLNDSSWIDISHDRDTWDGPLGKVTNTWGGSSGMASDTVRISPRQKVRACAYYAGEPHCLPWKKV